MNDKPFEVDIDEFTRYRVGVGTFETHPEQEKFKHMLHLVAYDIREPKRLRKVALACEDFGIRVEYSVFECDLDEQTFQKMWNTLLDIMDTEEDSLLAYRICGSCVKQIESAGMVLRPGKILIYML